jgi:hypothetical protein
MTQDFPTSVLMDATDADVTPNTKWACHVGFDNLGYLENIKKLLNHPINML